MSDYRIIPDKVIPGPINTGFADIVTAQAAAEAICRDHNCNVRVCRVLGFYTNEVRWIDNGVPQ